MIGMAFETLNNAENIGYIIPVCNDDRAVVRALLTNCHFFQIPVVNHFLRDYEVHGSYVGFCKMGIRCCISF